MATHHLSIVAMDVNDRPMKRTVGTRVAVGHRPSAIFRSLLASWPVLTEGGLAVSFPI